MLVVCAIMFRVYQLLFQLHCLHQSQLHIVEYQIKLLCAQDMGEMELHQT